MQNGTRVSVTEGKYQDEPGTLISIDTDQDMATVNLDNHGPVRVWSSTPTELVEVPVQNSPPAKPASPKQISYIKALLAEREGPIVESFRDSLNRLRVAGQTIPASLASEVITELLKIKRVYAPSVGASVQAAEVECGYYVRDEDGVKAVYVVVDNKAGTRRYAKKLVISEVFDNFTMQHGGRKTARWDYVKGGIYTLGGLAPLSVEEAGRLGHQHGVCVVCTKQLTTPASVQRGIGPVCIKRLSK
jgi:hypothetical protein